MAAGIDATYTILDYPFPVGPSGGNAHGFLRVERELIQTTDRRELFFQGQDHLVEDLARWRVSPLRTYDQLRGLEATGNQLQGNAKGSDSADHQS